MAMRYRLLGGTGIRVSAYCLGTMMFGSIGNADRADSIRVIHAALGQGINFVDTADMYSAGESEKIAAQPIAGRRDDIVLATKFHFPMSDDPNSGGNSRRWIMRAVDDSLRRLRTGWLYLYWGTREGALASTGRARAVPSARRRSRPSRSLRASGSRSAAAWPVSGPSSRPTRCWPAASRPGCCPPASATASAC